MSPETCSKCGDPHVRAKGLCGACYQRSYRRRERSEVAICQANYRRLEREMARTNHMLVILREV